MSRLAASRFARVLLAAGILLSVAPALGAVPNFRDVSASTQYRAAIESLRTAGVIEGYGDATFKPGSTINRAEFLKIVLGSRGQSETAAEKDCFGDVRDEWFAPVVCSAKRNGIIQGYPDGLFHPEREISFVEAAKIIALAYGQDVESGGEWYEPYARALEASKSIPPSISDLEQRITRGEMVEMMWRLREGRTDQPTKGYLNVKYPQLRINLAADVPQRAQSCADLRAFVSEAGLAGTSASYGRSDGPMMIEEAMPAVPGAAMMKASDSALPPQNAGADFSRTNVQVEGVDEGDIVKTDGTYIYIVSNQSIRIVKAIPTGAMEVMSVLDLEENAFVPTDLYVEGNRLIVVGSRWTPGAGGPHIMNDVGNGVSVKMMAPSIWPGPWYSTQKAEVRIYDVSDRRNPALERKVSIDGSAVSTRKIGNKLYLVANDPVRWTGPGPIPLNVTENDILPRIEDSRSKHDEPVARCGDVMILPHQPSPQFLTVAVIPTDRPGAQVERTTVLGNGENVYASLKNLYVASTRWQYSWRGGDGQSSEQTDIFRFAFTDDGVDARGQGSVPGHLLNQFSMDEHDNVFRIATTVAGRWNGSGAHETPSTNNVYTLNMDLERLGSIEDIAPGETIYSARFLGNRAYLVTFKTVDPLFVLDLADARNPRILGKLKIPGYSNYLHPYDETHLIGFGKEVDESIDKDKVHSDNAVYYTAVQGMKIALFDVSDVEHPTELFKTVIGERGTDSPLLQNHKALLFDRDRGLLAFPVMVTGKPSTGSEPMPVFQGAYVYDLNLRSGFTLRGSVTHYDDEDMQKAGGYWYGGRQDIQRILRIGDSLFTISNAQVQAHGENNVKKEGAVVFGD